MLSRKAYWIKLIVSMVAAALVSFFISIFTIIVPEIVLITIPLVFIAAIILAIVQLIWMRQRFHDVGLSGAWILLSFVPAIGGIAVFIITLLPSETFDMWGY